MSYTIDVYRRDAPVQRNMVNFGAFVTMFPQLIAGPIVKYKDGGERTCATGIHTSEKFASGVPGGSAWDWPRRCCWPTPSAQLWDVLPRRPGGRDADRAGGLAGPCSPIGFQIYFDFSGYSDMAIGLGRMFGFRFNENFDYPYLRRLRDGVLAAVAHVPDLLVPGVSVYPPGRQPGAAPPGRVRNLLIVWFCTGFWHGASWNFILWGLYFAAWLILERYVLRGVLEKTPAMAQAPLHPHGGVCGLGPLCHGGPGRVRGLPCRLFRRRAALERGGPASGLRSYAVTLGGAGRWLPPLWARRLWAKLPRQAEQLATPVLMLACRWCSARPIWWTAATTPSCISGSERRQRPCPNAYSTISHSGVLPLSGGADGVADAPAGPGAVRRGEPHPASSGRHFSWVQRAGRQLYWRTWRPTSQDQFPLRDAVDGPEGPDGAADRQDGCSTASISVKAKHLISKVERPMRTAWRRQEPELRLPAGGEDGHPRVSGADPLRGGGVAGQTAAEGARVLGPDRLPGPGGGGLGLPMVDFSGALTAHADEPIFYRTDHHWTSLGAFYGANALLEVLGRAIIKAGKALHQRLPAPASTARCTPQSGIHWLTPDTMEFWVKEDGLTVTSWRTGSPEPGSTVRPELSDREGQIRLLPGRQPTPVRHPE